MTPTAPWWPTPSRPVSVGVVQYTGSRRRAVAAGALAFGLIGLSASPRLATMLA